jgi:hypothetical protein
MACLFTINALAADFAQSVGAELGPNIRVGSAEHSEGESSNLKHMHVDYSWSILGGGSSKVRLSREEVLR